MIRVQGQTNVSHDPKLKVPLVASAGARAAAERTVSTGDIAALRKEIAALGARVAALEVNSHVPVDFTPMLDRIAALEGKLSRDAKPRRDAKPPRDEKPRGAKPADAKPRGGRPRKRDGEPWKAEGVSRSTWERRQKAKG